MSEVLFYHLTATTLEDTLPVLVARSRERGWRVIIRAGSPERLEALDNRLWTYDEESFLAHGLASEPNPETQPVLLTTADERPNEAEMLFLVDGAPLPAEWPFARVALLFDGHDNEAVAAARAAWKAVGALGHAATYWKQDEDGRWKKAG